jgi:galactose mutarotase-like enzyme
VTEEKDALRFTLRDTEKTREIYPFAFCFEVTYRLTGRTLSVELSAANEGEKILPFTMGAHPGFNVPLGGGSFEDYTLTFGEDCAPYQMEISEDGFRTGREEVYALREGRVLPLRHSLFDIDGIFLYGMASSVRLSSEKSERYVEVRYPDMPYLGFWHSQGVSNFICIEPWCAMPAIEGQSEDLEKKDGLFRIGPKETRKATVDMIFG